MAGERAVRIDPTGPEGGREHRPVDLQHLARYTLGERALEREVLELMPGVRRIQGEVRLACQALVYGDVVVKKKGVRPKAIVG